MDTHTGTRRFLLQYVRTTSRPSLLPLDSGHPLAMAAGIATLEVYQEQAIFENAAVLEPYFEQLLHSLKGLPHVVDIRNIGLMGAVEVAPIAGFPVARSMVIIRCNRSLW